jgi:hypothetical protein
MLRSMGVEPTGLDIDALLALRAQVAGWLQGETAARHAVARRPAQDAAGLPDLEHYQDMSNQTNTNKRPRPLEGLRVVEFTHMVMGPTCGMVLADLGAEVIKVEPIGGDRTRHLLGAGAGFFPMFNRGKKSIAIDLHTPEGAAVARKLALSADVVAENFKPGTMTKYGLDYAALSAQNERLIYVSTRAFCPAPTSTARRSTRWCR